MTTPTQKSVGSFFHSSLSQRDCYLLKCLYQLCTDYWVVHNKFGKYETRMLIVISSKVKYNSSERPCIPWNKDILLLYSRHYTLWSHAANRKLHVQIIPVVSASLASPTPMQLLGIGPETRLLQCISL